MATHSSTLAWRIPWTEEVGYNPWGHKELDMTEWLNRTKDDYIYGSSPPGPDTVS